MGSATYMGGSHLEFSRMPLLKGRKLHTYKIYNKQLDQLIGEIHWRGGWRQYVFEALPDIEMSRSCMKELIKKIDKLMKEWRELKKQEKKQNA